jgi:hypothetical protein
MGAKEQASLSQSDMYPLTTDEYGIGWVKGRYYHVWFLPRPAYCDRGHYIAHVEAAPDAGLKFSIDEADKWPRYYMDRERMLGEIRDWLEWREGDGPRAAGNAVFRGLASKSQLRW